MNDSNPMASYSSATRGLVHRVREALALYRIRTKTGRGRVDQLTAEAAAFEQIIERNLGERVEGKAILEIGPGHFLIQSYYFARKNKVTAIDLDVIPIGVNPMVYLSMFAHNGLQRSVKTILRKAMGIDAQHRRFLKERLRVKRLPQVRLLRGNVCQLEFPDSSFDVVVCRSVLHHIPKPQVALNEMARVLRPGGVVVANFHLYTSHNGSLDPRVMSGDYDESLMWAHLRPSMAGDFRGNSFLNQVRLDEWRSIFAESWRGCAVETEKSSREGVEPSARKAVASGSISGYSFEELTTHTVLAYWKKPSGSPSTGVKQEVEASTYARPL